MEGTFKYKCKNIILLIKPCYNLTFILFSLFSFGALIILKIFEK